MARRITRRTFIQVGGAAALGVFLPKWGARSAASLDATSTLTPTDALTPIPTRTPIPSATALPTFTSTPTVTPFRKPTATPIPELPRQPMQVARNINVAQFPPQVFDSTPTSIRIGDYYHGRNPNIGLNSLIERLANYEGFQDAVIHVRVDSPSAANSNQHSFISIERAQEKQTEGSWAFEVSVKVLQAPRILVHTGWQ